MGVSYVFRTLYDLNLQWAGKMACPAGYTYTHVLPEGFLLHYVISGKGVLKRDGRVYQVHGGQAFVIFDQEMCTYQADLNDPWNYEWFCLTGGASSQLLDSLGVTRDEPVYTTTAPEAVNLQFDEFVLRANENDNFFLIIGELLKLFGIMSASCDKQSVHEVNSASYIDLCKSFIIKNYMQKIDVGDLLRLTRIDPSHLYRLFKKETGLGPKEYITNFKLRKALELLSTSEIPVLNVANLVGYDDSAAFSKLFKKKYGVSPTCWRKQNLNKKQPQQ